MTDSSNPLRLRILSPHGTLLDTKAFSVRLTAVDGMIGIHKAHPTALIMLTHGKAEYIKDGKPYSTVVDGVFAEVKNDVVTVMAEQLQSTKE